MFREEETVLSSLFRWPMLSIFSVILQTSIGNEEVNLCVRVRVSNPTVSILLCFVGRRPLGLNCGKNGGGQKVLTIDFGCSDHTNHKITYTNFKRSTDWSGLVPRPNPLLCGAVCWFLPSSWSFFFFLSFRLLISRSLIIPGTGIESQFMKCAQGRLASRPIITPSRLSASQPASLLE